MDLLYSNIFNKDTLNIFTDASIKQDNNGIYTGCPGCICVNTDKSGNQNIFDTFFTIEYNSTNNNSELKAILHGVFKALQYRNDFKYINLFSDSAISINGLKSWIYSWMNNIHNDTMFNSSGMEVANQDVIKNIIYYIVQNDLKISLFYQKGHVKNYSVALKAFKNINKISTNIDVIETISYYNDYVDNFTRNMLKQNEMFKSSYVFEHKINNNIIKKYEKLIGGI